MTNANDYKPLDLAAFEGHTPEPWAQAGDGSFILAGGCAIFKAYSDEFPTQPHGCTVPGFRDALANSALAAAAPQLLRERNELLAALKRVLRVAECSPPTIKEVLRCGDDAIDAAGLNPWCVNEGLAEGSEPVRFDSAWAIVDRIEGQQ